MNPATLGASLPPLIPVIRREAELLDTLMAEGAVILKGISALTALESLGNTFLPYQHPDADAAGATLITPNNRQGQIGDGFTTRKLSFHTDRSSVTSPPEVLICELKKTDRHGGGRPLFSDARRAVRSLSRTTLKPLRQMRLSLPNEVKLPLFFTTDGRHRMRYREDRHTEPLGDTESFSAFRAALHAHAFVPEMTAGDTYVLLNDVFVHGRTHIIDPERKIVRILATCTDPGIFSSLTAEWDVLQLSE